MADSSDSENRQIYLSQEQLLQEVIDAEERVPTPPEIRTWDQVLFGELTFAEGVVFCSTLNTIIMPDNSISDQCDAEIARSSSPTIEQLLDIVGDLRDQPGPAIDPLAMDVVVPDEANGDFATTAEDIGEEQESSELSQLINTLLQRLAQDERGEYVPDDELDSLLAMFENSQLSEDNV